MAQSAQVKKVNWWHEAIFEWMISNPSSSLGEAATFFEVTQSWLSVIINSDVFKEKLAERRCEHFQHVSRTVAERVNGLAELSLDVLEERIESERKTIGLGLVRETADMALKASGYIGPKSDGKSRGDTYIGNIQISSDVLKESRALMNKTIEVPAIEVKKEE